MYNPDTRTWRTVSNDSVIPHTKAGTPAKNGTGSFYSAPGIHRPFLAYYGGSWLAQNMRQALQELAPKIEFTVYSYSTPIAFRIAGVWLKIDDRFSATTSTRHQTHLWQLDARPVMRDATAEDILRIARGQMSYVPEYRKPGRLVAV